MSTRNTNIIIPLEAASLDATGLTGGWDQLSEGHDYAVYLFRLTNDSDADVQVSFDGSTTHDYLLAGSAIDIGAHPTEHVCWPERTGVWLKGGAAQAGYIYLAAYTIKKDLEF